MTHSCLLSGSVRDCAHLYLHARAGWRTSAAKTLQSRSAERMERRADGVLGEKSKAPTDWTNANGAFPLHLFAPTSTVPLNERTSARSGGLQTWEAGAGSSDDIASGRCF